MNIWALTVPLKSRVCTRQLDSVGYRRAGPTARQQGEGGAGPLGSFCFRVLSLATMGSEVFIKAGIIGAVGSRIPLFT